MKKINKLILLSLILGLFSFSLYGCRLKEEEQSKTKEQIIETIKVIEHNEQDLLNKLQSTNEQKDYLTKKIEENKNNDVFSEDIGGVYILSDANSNTIKKINVNNVSKNFSTKDDYGSIFLETSDTDTLSSYGLFYSFVPELDYSYFIENVPQVFCDTKITEITYTQESVALENVFVEKIFEIKCIDEVGVEFYGYAFTYDANTENNILCIIFSKTPYLKDSLETIVDNFSKIE